MRLMLDSSFVIDHLLGEERALARWRRILADGDEPYVNEVVVCEVSAGLKPADEGVLTGLLEPIEFVQPGPAASLRAGRWRWDAARRGRTLSLADALIASAADALGGAVLTRNVRDFALTPVPLESY